MTTVDLTLSVIVAPHPKSPNIRPFHFVYQNYAQIGRTTDYSYLFRYLDWQLHVFLASQTRDYYLLHSGAVATAGSGIIFPGGSGAGKSSLTLALLEQGYSYLSDEVAAVDLSTNNLHSFPKPIGIKDTSIFPLLSQRQDIWLGSGSGERTGEEPVWYVHPEDVAPRCIGSPVPIRYIIFPRYAPSARTQLQPLSVGQSMPKLIENSINFMGLGPIGFRFLTQLVQEAQCFSLSFNDLDEAITIINRLTGVVIDQSTPLTR